MEPRFYGRRKGKRLTTARQDLLERRLADLTIAEGDGIVDPASLFSFPFREIWLEIGFGGGEHLAAQAQANPEIGFIGAEVFLNGVASLLRHVEERSLANIRIWPEDVRHLLMRIPEHSVSRIFVLYPDPWPKRRHAERRFIGPENLCLLARLLKDGGELRVASDDPTYQRWVLRHAPVHPDFTWEATGPESWKEPWDDWVRTRYEAKALREGRTPMYFIFRRRPRA
ncbi:MAG: tRNA (guanosine(46)-N7)-methyltransferase TrmB [Alphaproteobacteria bacterium RIFOXYD12_FULL_60_8]|nr:MAG: tRNA (guanosine(46)-N7)-methyltransferase TrmB [Alphaproteobacteria bacterium RIFOXYD12_FULL_60_8]